MPIPLRYKRIFKRRVSETVLERPLSALFSSSAPPFIGVKGIRFVCVTFDHQLISEFGTVLYLLNVHLVPR